MSSRSAERTEAQEDISHAVPAMLMYKSIYKNPLYENNRSHIGEV